MLMQMLIHMTLSNKTDVNFIIRHRIFLMLNPCTHANRLEYRLEFFLLARKKCGKIPFPNVRDFFFPHIPPTKVHKSHIRHNSSLLESRDYKPPQNHRITSPLPDKRLGCNQQPRQLRLLCWKTPYL